MMLTYNEDYEHRFEDGCAGFLGLLDTYVLGGVSRGQRVVIPKLSVPSFGHATLIQNSTQLNCTCTIGTEDTTW